MSGTQSSEVVKWSEKSRNLTDRAFAGLPIPGVKKRVDELTINKNIETVLTTLLEWKLTIVSEWKSGRYIDRSTWYYIYTVALSDGTQMDIVFYSIINTKVMIKVNHETIEMQVMKDDPLLEQLSKLYTLPIYTQDGNGWVRLIASL